jgi:putative ABC transport system substrate-binding protein
MKRMFLSLCAATVLIWVAVPSPFHADAQQQPLPVVGYLSFTSPDERPTLVAAFRQGLGEAGFVVGQNVAIEYRSADGNYERLPVLAAELVKIPVAVIAATGGEASGRAAKAATSQIPIVFTSGSDAVKGGLVASLNRDRAAMSRVLVCLATNSTQSAYSFCMSSFPAL